MDLSPEAISPAPGVNLVAALVQRPEVIIDYVAPQVVRRVAPHLPSGLRNLAVAGHRVGVKVYIDATGTVVRTEPISKGNALSGYFSIIAADAARQWRFSPARRGNENVSSETVLDFDFGTGHE